MKTKPLVIVDIDDVLIWCNTPLQEWHNQAYGGNIQSMQEVFNYRLEHVWGCTPEEVWPRILEFYDTDFFKQAGPLPGAVEYVQRLAEIATLYSFTARPLSTRQDTHSQLRAFNGSISEIIFSEDIPGKNKGALAKAVGASIAIDDAHHNAEDYVRAGITPILYNHDNLFGWNDLDKAPEGSLTSSSWKQNYELVTEYIGRS